VARNLGLDFGVAPYMVHRKDPEMIIAGISKRWATYTPPNQLIRQFRNFVRNWLRANLIPLAPETDVSFDSWLKSTAYPDWRKKELIEAAVDLFKLPLVKLQQVKGFVKIEEYEEPKLARLINARCDAAKVTFGPYIKAIEHEVYKLHHFSMKHIPVPDRAKLIHETLKNYEYIWNNDYTSFEAHFTPKLLEVCEFQLYSYMLRNVKRGLEVIGLLKKVLAGKNKPRYTAFSAQVEGARMSGEMSTSLGNGFTNLMAVLFLAHRKGFNCDGFVEGDDGIFGSNDGVLTDADFEEIGFITKMEILHKPNIAKFCQLVYETNSFSVIPNVRRIFRKFAWTHASQKDGGPKVLARLLRAKALSLAYEAPRCPVLRSLAKLGLRLTRGIKPLFTDEYWIPPDEAKVLDIFEDAEISIDARILMQEVQHISISQQLQLEKWLDGIEKYGKYDIPVPLFNSSDLVHYARFVRCYNAGEYAYGG
jgi:hypothetical protein